MAGLSNQLLQLPSGIHRFSLERFDEYRVSHVSTNERTIVFENWRKKIIVQICTSIRKARSLPEGKYVHAQVIKSDLTLHMLLGSLLVRMYAKLDILDIAFHLFYATDCKDVISWTVLIASCSKFGLDKEALQLFRQIRQVEIIPNKFTFSTVLTACSATGSLEEGKEIHANIVRYGLESDLVVGSALVNMYGNFRKVKDARMIFDKLSRKDLISWNIMITAYIHNGNDNDAMQLFQEMALEGMPNKVTYISMLNTHGSSPCLARKKIVHSTIISSRFGKDIIVENALINMYSKCRSMKDANMMFYTMDKHDLLSWNAVLAGYAQVRDTNSVFHLFYHMQFEGFVPSNITMIIVLNACAISVALAAGKKIHSHIVSKTTESNTLVGNALINMYGRCQCLKDSWSAFQNIPMRDVISWNAIISTYAEGGYEYFALQLLEEMQTEGITADRITCVHALSACSSLIEKGKYLHAHVICKGFESDIVVGNAIINLYAKNRYLEDAMMVFSALHQQCAISWNVMITAYASNEHGREALELFDEMQLENVEADVITFVSLLDACSSLACLLIGKKLHGFIVEKGIESNISICNSLVSMYGKCGSPDDAKSVFLKLLQHNVVSWASLILAFGQHGYGQQAIQYYVQMQMDGIFPNNVTLVNILSACSHAGLLYEGYHYFVSMSTDFDMLTTAEHYGCMIHVLGRLGWLDEGTDFIINTPFQLNVELVSILVGAFIIRGDVRGAHHVAESIMGSVINKFKISRLFLLRRLKE